MFGNRSSRCVGIVLYRSGAITADDLIRNADAAMYAAKSSGTGSWRVFKAAMHHAALSLSYLRSFPVDVLKIDKSFTDTVAVDVEGAGFVQAILHLAQVLRVTTVAEGVEHAAQAERLRELGCDLAQGFYFGRPAAEALLVRIAYSSSAQKRRSLKRVRERGYGR